MLAMINEILTTILLVTAIIIAITVLILLYRLSKETGKQKVEPHLRYGETVHVPSSKAQEIQQPARKSSLEPTLTLEEKTETGMPSPEEYSWVLRLGKTRRKEEEHRD